MPGSHSGGHLTLPLYVSLQAEAAKWQELRPYLVSSPKRGVIGNSRYAKRLRAQILAAAKAGNRSATQLQTMHRPRITEQATPSSRPLCISLPDELAWCQYLTMYISCSQLEPSEAGGAVHAGQSRPSGHCSEGRMHKNLVEWWRRLVGVGVAMATPG